MFVSIVVCAYQQKDLVRETLLSLVGQTYAMDQFEVVVADDGSTDGTSEMVHSLDLPYDLQYFWQENKGRAAARNLGIRQAKGDLVIFLDGDITAQPYLVKEHVGSHLSHDGVMVMGKVELSPGVPGTPFTEIFLSRAYDPANHADANGFIPFIGCATGNLSITSKDLNNVGPFDEDFHEYGWEDAVFGYQAHLQGLRILYNPRAISYHNDYALDFKSHCQRYYRSVKAPLFYNKYPHLEKYVNMLQDKGWIDWRHDRPKVILKKLIRQSLAAQPALSTLEAVTSVLEDHWPHPRPLALLYRIILGCYILKGYREGLELRQEQQAISCRP